MFFLRILWTAVRNLQANFLRSLLAVLGIIIGVGTVIAAVGVIEGASRDVMEDMQKVGANVMWVRPGSAKVRGRRMASVKELKAEDVDDIQKLPSVVAASPEVQRISQVKFASENDYGFVFGTTPAFFEVFKYTAQEGTLFGRDAQIGARRVATLGPKLAKRLFKDVDPVGQQIRLGRETFTVLGVMKEKGLVGWQDFDNIVYIPLSRAMRMYNPRSLDQISVRSAELSDLDAAKSSIAGVLRRKHSLQVGEDDDFTIITQTELYEEFKKIITIWQAVFFSISVISLVVGGFGIMNIMLVSVTERTREIGIRMAVGARRGDILVQFLAESSMICVVGAPLGIGLGWAINDVVKAKLAPLEPIIAPTIVAIAVGVAIVTGLISGLYPAWRASRLDPVEALRYE